MSEKSTSKNKAVIFDDSMLPVNRITLERSEEIAKLVEPKIDGLLEKFSRENPHLVPENKTAPKKN